MCNYRLFRHPNTCGNFTMQLSMQAGILHASCAKSHEAQVPHEGSRHQLLQSSGIPQQMTGPASLSTAIVCGHVNVPPMHAGCKTSRLSHESLRRMGYRLPQPRAGKCRSGVCEILAKCTSTEPLYMQLSRAASVKDSACLDTITELGPAALDDCGPVCLPGAIMNCENLQKIHKAKSGASHRKPRQVFKRSLPEAAAETAEPQAQLRRARRPPGRGQHASTHRGTFFLASFHLGTVHRLCCHGFPTLWRTGFRLGDGEHGIIIVNTTHNY